MKKKHLKYLNDLIAEGNLQTFDNNKEYSHYGHEYYSKATDSLNSWISKVDNFIRTNYSENSGPFRMNDSVKKDKFTGWSQSEFETEIKKLKGALSSCLQIEPNKKSDDHLILSLIKNPIFWSVIVVLTGASFAIGQYFGASKFDKEKSDYYNKTIQQESDIKILKQIIKEKESTIETLQSRLINK